MTAKQPDRNFNDLSNRFSRTIYETAKGQLRLQALEADFNYFELLQPSVTLLDIGGGQGQFSLWCAQQGAEVTLYDISDNMLDQAQQRFASAGVALTAQQTSLQQASEQSSETYDIVCNHAVLEWLEQPIEALPQLIQFVRPGGYLSLMFYNEAGHQWRQLMNGRTHAPLSSNPRLRKEGNAPQHPLDVDLVINKLSELGMDCLQWRGIRCVHDHMHQKIRDRIGAQAVATADLEMGLQEPFKRLGRYVHLVLKKPLNAT